MASGPMYLTVLRRGDTIAMDLTEPGPVVPRGQIRIEEGLLTDIGDELAQITALANKRSLLDIVEAPAPVERPNDSHRALQRLGVLIFSHFFPAPIRQSLAATAPTDLFLRLDDQLVHVPWELAFDGQDFLLTRFRIGRQVMTHHVSSHTPVRKDPHHLRMLIIVDPTESLTAASEEANQLCDLLEARSDLEVSVIGGKQLRKIELLQALNEHDLVHYAGHACFDPAQPDRSGWVLHDAVLTASELSKVAHPPLLVFSNACQAGATTQWQPKPIYEGQAFGIGSAFLLAGVQNYLGTFYVIHDTHSAAFAADFYGYFLQGERLGAALAAARQKARHETERTDLLWASYMHYGDPTFRVAPPRGSEAAVPESVPRPVEIHAPDSVDTGPAEQQQEHQVPYPDPTESGVRTPDALLRERIKLDERLQRQFHRDVTLLFTDIKGSTAYFEQHGDLSGRLMVQYSNDLLFPIVARHQGSVVKTIGDSVMASFDAPTSAVLSAIAMQRALRDHNSSRSASDQIHIRIGINSGQGFVETGDIFGDVVNVASRIESCALPDQILISEATYRRLPETIPCRFLGATEVKGKSTPISLYEVHWDERKTIQETVLLRGPGVIRQRDKVFVLEVSRQAEGLRLSAYERVLSEEHPFKPYDDLTVVFASVQQAVDLMMTLLSRATGQRGTLDASTWEELKAIGKTLYEQLFPPSVREKLQASTAADLVLYLDDDLVQIPWELLFDGHTFLCRRFNMGRIVSVPQTMVKERVRTEKQELTMLVIADPRGDLEAAAREGEAIQAELASVSGRLQLAVRKTDVNTTEVKTLLAQYEVLHFAGHAEYDLQDPAQSGWLMADGKLPSTSIQHMGETASVPRLVFCNACRSGQTPEWRVDQQVGRKIYGLAHAFLLAGAQHYIGTLWEIPDQPGSTFAVHFYRALARRDSMGEALRHARYALVEYYGEESAVWASYVLYGDPTFCYLDAQQEKSSAVEETEPLQAAAQKESRLSEIWRAIAYGKKRLVLGVGVVLLLFLAGAVTVFLRSGAPPAVSTLSPAYQALEHGDWPKAQTLFQQLAERAENRVKSQGYTGLAAVAFAQGDYQQALNFAEQAEVLDPETSYSHVIRGHILWNQGKTPEAKTAYRTAIQKPHALPWQQAIAYNRLGRLSAAQGSLPEALAHYDKAINQNQGLAAVYTNKAYLLEKLGKRQEALVLYRQALQASPDDPLTTMLLRQAEYRQQLVQDREQQQRIDQLVKELVQAYKDGRGRRPSGDGWTSTPVTLALLHFQPKGTLSPRAGEDDFVVLSLTQALQADGRITVVEREILDKLLVELKLSTSELVNPQVALRMGEILAARLIATGSFTRFGEEGQLSIRLIETDTTRIRALVVESVEKPHEIDAVVARTSATLLQKVRQAYPLQGRIVGITPQGVILLNIGAQHGVTPGLVMQVFGSEEALEVDGKVAGYHRTAVGRIEVTSVETKHSQARVLEQTGAFEQGRKVKEVIQK